MTDHTANLHASLWDIDNTLRGKMDADEFRDYILGCIFYKYLREKMHSYADELLKPDGMGYMSLIEGTAQGDEYLAAIKEEELDKLGYFFKRVASGSASLTACVTSCPRSWRGWWGKLYSE